MTTTATQRGKPQSDLLHRVFTSATLKPWRRQPLLQFDMEAGKRRRVTRSPAQGRRLALPRIRDRVIGDDHGSLKELREKLLDHLRETANKLKIEMPLIGPAVLASEKAGQPKLEPAPSSTGGETGRPWNLRLRTTARRTSAVPVHSPAKKMERTVCIRSARSEKKKRRISISLSREEIEEDLFALTGSRPRRRPKKRPRNVQWRLDTLFPGLCLPEITPELYKVPE
ncbi:uncharacterized protein LOC110038891 [Phalaenopsis equestris]|uniref:uncharacterized protein LOC110038891 n=1 Tax=Phalaenopsis equestris TaxID=78828 RepID=UPI0009E58013|nr:uncharacterized protein LOC110038891 [Phalaenopsis equestris]